MFYKCGLLLLTTLLLVLVAQAAQILYREEENGIKYGVFLSPKFELGQGGVLNSYYYNIDFPRGHIAIKEFNADVVDEMINPVPLTESYLHHWLTNRYYTRLTDNGTREVDRIGLRNSGTCQMSMPQVFGVGSETRKLNNYVPDPYGIEAGNPAEIPDGYVERWYLNIHAIDTRGVVDKLGCAECRCDLYNKTTDEYGEPLPSNYRGGLLCCGNNAQCRVKEGFPIKKRITYMRYTVRWVDWSDSVVPVKVYVLDATDDGERAEGPIEVPIEILKAVNELGCKTEYTVETCDVAGVSSNGCVDAKRATVPMPVGGYIVYSVAHQHHGGVGLSLYAGDGRNLCTSLPIIGDGHENEAGNENGYIVGMSTCLPKQPLKISLGEKLVVESNYSNSQLHTGVMGTMYILVADHPANDILQSIQVYETMKLPSYSWALVFIGVAILAFIAGISLRRRNGIEEKEYESLVARA